LTEQPASAAQEPNEGQAPDRPLSVKLIEQAEGRYIKLAEHWDEHEVSLATLEASLATYYLLQEKLGG
jgi:hypothetical protein